MPDKGVRVSRMVLQLAGRISPPCTRPDPEGKWKCFVLPKEFGWYRIEGGGMGRIRHMKGGRTFETTGKAEADYDTCYRPVISENPVSFPSEGDKEFEHS